VGEHEPAGVGTGAIGGRDHLDRRVPAIGDGRVDAHLETRRPEHVRREQPGRAGGVDDDVRFDRARAGAETAVDLHAPNPAGVLHDSHGADAVPYHDAAAREDPLAQDRVDHRPSCGHEPESDVAHRHPPPELPHVRVARDGGVAAAGSP
jgi:hypothetical protein